jgi:hypothetical protein
MNSRSYQDEDEFLKDFLHNQETDDTFSRPSSPSEMECSYSNFLENQLISTGARKDNLYTCSKLINNSLFQPVNREVADAKPQLFSKISSSSTYDTSELPPRRQTFYIESHNRENEQSPFKSVGRRNKY